MLFLFDNLKANTCTWFKENGKAVIDLDLLLFLDIKRNSILIMFI